MNNIIFRFFYGFAHQSPVLDSLIVFTAQTFPYIVILGALIFMLGHHEVLSSANPFQEFFKKWKEIVFVFFASGMAWCVARFLKFLIHTPRPFVAFSDVQSLVAESGFAFPSGHATFYSALAVSILLVHKKAGYWFFVCALLIGIARIAAGVHFPVDILGGFVYGSLVAYAARALLNRFAYLGGNI